MFFGLFKRAKKSIEEVRFGNLKKWLDESESINNILIQFHHEVKDCFSQLNAYLNKIEKAVQVLKATSLEHRKADEKIKNIVLQNKSIYIERVQQLISRFQEEIAITKKDSLESIEQFTSVVSEQINTFSKQSFKSFHITSELIGKELEEVVNCIAQISNTIEKIKVIDKEKVKTIIFVKNCLGEIETNEKIIDNLKIENERKFQEKQLTEKKLAEAEKKNEEIKSSREWKKKQDLISNIATFGEELKANSLAIKSLFLSIEKALKKWAWKEKNEKVLVYLENPLAALKKDSNLEIISILSNIKEDIEQDKLELDEKRKAQLLSSISSITKESLIAFIEKENKIVNEIEKHKQELEGVEIKLVNVAHLENQKNDIFLKIAKLEKRKQSLKQDILNKKDQIEASLKTIFDINLIE